MNNLTQTSIRLLDSSELLEVNGGILGAFVGGLGRLAGSEAAASASVVVMANAPAIADKVVTAGQTAPYAGPIRSAYLNVINSIVTSNVNSLTNRFDSAVNEVQNWYRDNFLPGYR